MKTLIALAVVLSTSTVLAAPKDPRIEIAKKETAKLYREYMLNTSFKKLNILDQSNSYFLTQVVGRDKKNICFILEVNIVDNVPEVTTLENNNDVMNVFLRECTDKPTTDELNHFKAMNGWPVINN